MRSGRGKVDPKRMEALRASLAKNRALRDAGYREQALKLFPHVCARCGREFDGPKMRELTVHHKDHNHHNNPPDGSNWELLCLYCHDAEHQDPVQRGERSRGVLEIGEGEGLGHSPFAGLGQSEESERSGE